ncbi:hypothetical protein [Xanthomonas euroxanthea]|uniref:hypothetical protein n=1 Tax=Xanthomonas euroxanthea TaxID=2259622 RepID=UPI001C84C1D1|nr:hypothetical protein [Xanthomonas euroxanthea]
MRIVFMGVPVPVPVLEGGAYARTDAAGVNALPAIQPVGGMRHPRRAFDGLDSDATRSRQIAGKEKAAGNQRLSPNSLGAKK